MWDQMTNALSRFRAMTLGVVVPFLGLLSVGCASAPPAATAISLHRFEYSEVHMGVRARIVLYTASESEAIQAAKAAFARVAELDAIMSDYRVDSELMCLCDRAGGGPVAVSRDLIAILSFAGDLHDRSGGVFDVTAGPLVKLWREMRRAGTLAAPTELDAARQLVGWQWVRLNAETQTVDLTKPGMRLDLGGIAKGYACDGAATILRQRGVTRFLVAMAGDIVVGAAPPARQFWEVAVEGGVGASSEAGPPILHLTDSAVSTSGDAQQFVQIEERRYSHIVDPRTGLGSSRRIAATVVAPRGMMSDSIATALCLLPMDYGLELARQYRGVEVLIEEGFDAETRVRSSPGMVDLLAPRKKSVP